MKNKLIITIIFISCFGCKDIKEKLLPSFTVNVPDIKLNIPPIPFTQDKEVPVGALKANINMDSTIRAYTSGTFGEAAVSSVKVQHITFLLLNADEKNNLSNFESGRLRIYSDNDTAETDIALIDFPSSYADSLRYVPNKSADISNYLRGKQLSYNIFWKNRKVTTKRVNLIIRVSLAVQ